MQRQPLFWIVTVAAVTILILQLFVPPIVGLADQNDFQRVIGVFGYGAEPGPVPYVFAWVAPKYIPGPNFRAPGLEHFSSEYLFAGAAVLLNKLISRDGKLDIEIIGLIHALAFLAAFLRLLFVTRRFAARPLIWVSALVILTDVGYVEYWNTFYREPASCIFGLLLIAESIDLAQRERVNLGGMARWTLWAVLFAEAKELNAILGLALGLFCILLRARTTERITRIAALGSAVLITGLSILSIVTVPPGDGNARAYTLIFAAIVPESRDSASDLRTLGLDPRLRDYGGSAAWSPQTDYPALVADGTLGKLITPMTVLRFYLLRPTRFWRHIQAMLPIASQLRPECCGNFELSAGFPPRARSQTFAYWSAFHEHVLAHAAKIVVFLLPIPAIAILWIRIRGGCPPLSMNFVALLTTCCLIAFLGAIFGDAWENVRHLFLFNLLLDTVLVTAAAACWTAAARRFGGHGAKNSAASLQNESISLG